MIKECVVRVYNKVTGEILENFRQFDFDEEFNCISYKGMKSLLSTIGTMSGLLVGEDYVFDYDNDSWKKVDITIDDLEWAFKIVGDEYVAQFPFYVLTGLKATHKKTWFK